MGISERLVLAAEYLDRNLDVDSFSAMLHAGVGFFGRSEFVWEFFLPDDLMTTSVENQVTALLNRRGYEMLSV